MAYERMKPIYFEMREKTELLLLTPAPSHLYQSRNLGYAHFQTHTHTKGYEPCVWLQYLFADVERHPYFVCCSWTVLLIWLDCVGQDATFEYDKCRSRLPGFC